MTALHFLAAALVAYAHTCTAHMIMAKPVPYGSPNNSPLDASGGDWPCKIGSAKNDVTKIATMNNIVAGQPQKLSFTGSAVHGGGSCQLSLTMDKTITKDTQFKVFHSIEGGCPASASGNLNEGSNDGTVFNWTLPTDMPNGQYSLAWTWFNKIGNREMYMNCAPITVTGGADGKDGFDKLPDMFVANIKGKNGKYDGSQWSTTESKDPQFPEPGPSVDKGPGAALAPPVEKGGAGGASGGGASAGGASGSGASGSGASGAGASGAGASGSGASGAGTSGSGTSSGAGAGAGTNVKQANIVGADGSSGSGASAGGASSGASSDSASGGASSPSASAAPQASSAPAAPSTGGGACPAGSAPCSTPGSLVCIGPTQFGICDANMCAVGQAVAAGTSCANGAVAKRALPGRKYSRVWARHGRYFAGV